MLLLRTTGLEHVVPIVRDNLELIALYDEVTKIVYFIGNERMLIAHDSNRLRFS